MLRGAGRDCRVVPSRDDKISENNKKTARVLTFAIVYAILEKLLSKGGNVFSSHEAEHSSLQGKLKSGSFSR